MRKVEGHPDVGRLEARLLSLIREAKETGPAGPLTPVLVIVATTRQRHHLQRLLAGHFGALLNVLILHHARLATEAAAAAGAELPRVLPPRVREEILGGCLAGGLPGLSSYIEACPGALAALRSTMDDLREAGVEPAAARRVKGLTPRGREILELYARYAAAVESLANRGLADRAGRTREAARHARAFAARFHAVIHHGAYELIGSNLDLMRAVESSGVPVTWLVPAHATAPAFTFARRFLEESLEAGAGALPGKEGLPRLLGDRLELLYDEEAGAPEPLASGRVSFFHCQGAGAELREAAGRILSMLRGEDGDLAEIAIVARALTPYAPLLRPVLRQEHGLPFTTSAAGPAVENPHVLAALRLARLLLEGYERQPLLDLARTGLLRPDGRVGMEDAAAWDLLSRRFAVSRDADAWRGLGRRIDRHFSWLQGDPSPRRGEGGAGKTAAGAPPAFGSGQEGAGESEGIQGALFPSLDAGGRDAQEAARRRAIRRQGAWKAAAGKLAGLIDAFEEKAESLRKAPSWQAWSDVASRFFETWIEGFQRTAQEGGRSPAGVETVRNVLAEMRLLGEAGVPFDVSQALPRFERALADETIPLGNAGGEEDLPDNGGVRILDGEQARGLAFRHVFLIGFNADLIPRRPREDPFLPDADRSRIRAALSVPVPVKSAAREEERLLLAHLLGSARESLTISWQRSDDSGRARVPSLALREVARIVLGEADPGLPLQPEHALRVAAHPGALARDSLERFGLMPPAAARLGTALSAGSPGTLAAWCDALPDPGRAALAANLKPGLVLLETVESFEAGDLAYDGFVGDAAPPRESWSPSQLERMGNCALHFFFRDVLGVHPMDEILPEHQIESSEMGLLAHDVLRETYQALIEEGSLSGPGSRPGKAARRGVELMEKAWSHRADAMAARMHRRYPLLWASLSELWRNALRTFLLHDIAGLEREEARVVAVEHEVTASLIVDRASPPLAVAGRFDRLVRSGDGHPVVADYKTGGNLKNRVDPARIVKGRALQLPLYVLMEEAEARAQGRDDGGISAEVIGIGPSFSEGSAAIEPQPEGYPARETLDAGKFGRIRGSLLETLRILVKTSGSGRFPLHPATTWCSWCPYARACRKGQAPTLARLAASPAARTYLALDGKSTRNLFLDPPREGRGEAS